MAHNPDDFIVNDDEISEASEAEEVVRDDTEDEVEPEPEENEGEDLFNTESLQRDYAPEPELDRYDPSMLDDSSEARELHPAERRRVERFLDARDVLLGQRGRAAAIGGGTLLLEEGQDEDDDEDEIWKILRARRERLRTRAEHAEGGIPVQEAEQAKEELPFCRSGTIGWTERVAEILEVVLTSFLCLFHRPEAAVNLASTLSAAEGGREAASGSARVDTASATVATYLQYIDDMTHSDGTSLMVYWNDLRAYCPKLLDWLYYYPSSTLSILSLAATQVTRDRFPRLYEHRRVTARLRGYEAIDSIRRLNTSHLNTLICVRGVVIRRTNVQPRLKLVYFECGRCHCDTLGPFEKRDGERIKTKLVCEDCQGTGPFSICREKTMYENFQTITIQEPPGQVTPGYVPKQKQVVILGDLVDSVRPGDEVVVTGIYQTKPDARLNATAGFPVFATHIIANNLERQREIQLTEITSEDLEIIHKLSRNPYIREKIIDSIAPSIWGHRHTKTGLAYAMIGGVPRKTAGHHTVRGDINFLILGDPGVGKSQFLKYVEKAFDRTIFTTGKGSSAVGLTAAVRRDDRSGEWYLEGGALVLADEGICLIDEFDKMAEQDRVSIHEAMEQQSISISKVGIVATLKARCAIIAAANPIYGRYDSSLTFNENVDLSSPILSRFDVLSVIKDQVHPITDEHLAEHVVRSHCLGHPRVDLSELSRGIEMDDPNDVEALGTPMDVNAEWITNSGRIPQSILRKYILYARRNCHPQLQRRDDALLVRFYSEIRQASLSGGGIPITVRHLESIVRMACANAKMRLSPVVDKRDLVLAIGTMVESFIQSQKYAVAVQLGRRFGRYRALAASPEEFIENVLTDELSRSTRKLMQRNRETIAVAMLQAEVPLAQLVCLVHTTYNLPEQAVHRYIESPRFQSRFRLSQNEGSDEKLIHYHHQRRPEAEEGGRRGRGGRRATGLSANATVTPVGAA